jgi:hypothetical protein
MDEDYDDDLEATPAPRPVRNPASPRQRSKLDQKVNAFANRSKKNRLIVASVLAAFLIGVVAVEFFIQHAANNAENNAVNQSTNSTYNP